jgi:hypothetical protein
VGLRGVRLGCKGVVGWKLITLGVGPIKSSISITQLYCLGSHVISLTVCAGAGALSSRLFSTIPSSSLLSSLLVLPSFSSLVCCLSSSLSSPFSLLSFSPSSVLPSSFSLLRPVLLCCSMVAAMVTVIVSAPCVISLIVMLAGLGGMSLSSVFWSLSALPISAAGVGVRAGVGAGAGVVVSDSKTVISFESGLELGWELERESEWEFVLLL